MSASPEPSRVLEAANLRVAFPGPAGLVTVVDGVSFTVGRGQRFGLVGESGSGKSITMLSILGLVDPPGEVSADLVCIAGQRVEPSLPASYRGVRGKAVSLVMQDPLTALSPVFTVGDQLGETIRRRFGGGRRAAAAEAASLLHAVGIADPAIRLRDYPHQLSGGMRQRVAIALALACQPALLIADEPTTALDATIRAQVMELLLRLADERQMAIALITHDFGLLAGFATEVAVMYGGRLVEQGSVDDLFVRPAHPYTRALLAAQPRLEGARRARLPAIPGQPPDPARRPAGCAFHPRCPLSRGRPRCAQETPALRPIGAMGQLSACHFAEEAIAQTPIFVGAAGR